jgi:tRNA pseudouridine(55) synthase
MAVISINKRMGETPLQCLTRLRDTVPEYRDEKLSYAGRLDPMAEGVLLVLVGTRTNQERARYLDLEKEYETEFLCGVGTDTHDILGIVEQNDKYRMVDEASFKVALEQFPREFEQLYPAFSSKTINGEALFSHARKNTLGTFARPSHKVSLLSKKYISSRVVSAIDLQKLVESRISKVIGDFRQAEIKSSWDRFFDRSIGRDFNLFRLCLTSGSGFYVRMLAHDMGVLLESDCLAFSIKRTRVGSYSLDSVIV